VSAPEPPDLDRLRAALAASAATDSRIDPGRMFDALHGELSSEERQALVDAIADDPEALEAWRLAMELTPGPAASVPARSVGRTSTWKWLGIAAALVLSVGLAWQLLAPWRRAEPPVYRSVDGRSIASELPDGVPLSRTAPVLRWTAIDEARYRIRVFTVDLQPLAEASDLSAPAYSLPPEVVSRLAGGAVVLWQVEAISPEGTVVSPTFTTRLQ
jgi:hypothetical protein